MGRQDPTTAAAQARLWLTQAAGSLAVFGRQLPDEIDQSPLAQEKRTAEIRSFLVEVEAALWRDRFAARSRTPSAMGSSPLREEDAAATLGHPLDKFLPADPGVPIDPPSARVLRLPTPRELAEVRNVLDALVSLGDDEGGVH